MHQLAQAQQLEQHVGMEARRARLRAQAGTSGRRRLRARSPDSSAMRAGLRDQARAALVAQQRSCARARWRCPAGSRRRPRRAAPGPSPRPAPCRCRRTDRRTVSPGRRERLRRRRARSTGACAPRSCESRGSAPAPARDRRRTGCASARAGRASPPSSTGPPSVEKARRWRGGSGARGAVARGRGARPVYPLHFDDSNTPSSSLSTSPAICLRGVGAQRLQRRADVLQVAQLREQLHVGQRLAAEQDAADDAQLGQDAVQIARAVAARAAPRGARGGGVSSTGSDDVVERAAIWSTLFQTCRSTKKSPSSTVGPPVDERAGREQLEQLDDAPIADASRPRSGSGR